MGYDRKQFAYVIIKYLSVLILLFNYGCSDINHNSRKWEEYEIKILRELSKAVEERRYSDILAFSDKALS